MYADELKKYANEETVAVPPPPWRSNYRNWLRAVVSVPTLPSLPSPVLISFATLSVLHSQSPPPLFQSTLRCHRVSAAITFSITSQ